KCAARRRLRRQILVLLVLDVLSEDVCCSKAIATDVPLRLAVLVTVAASEDLRRSKAIAAVVSRTTILPFGAHCVRRPAPLEGDCDRGNPKPTGPRPSRVRGSRPGAERHRGDRAEYPPLAAVKPPPLAFLNLRALIPHRTLPGRGDGR